MNDVTTLECALDGRRLEVGQVLARETEDRGRAAARERTVVRRGRLVAVGRTPDVDVGRRAEVRNGFDGLVSGTVLTETDGIVGSDPDNLVMAQGGQADGTSSV